MNSKKIINYILLILDAVMTISFLVLSLVMIIKMPHSVEEYNNTTGFLGYLYHNSTVYLFCFVIPLFILLGLNICYVVLRLYFFNHNKKDIEHKLTKKQKAELKEELIKESNNN